ncbi:electron transport complex subunit RsxG [Reinekea marinisedimentorum]|uniref:Ion-translocating oxidoreductase complex subunit G n=1 Tax=Reinekea marinisedimentorum TaxID=230495 RepID=A0A4R3I037_9GAMM|nr:electron transport complex subunit RsxG [Reinekea marinisedimentorum]TCS38878.1 electron transport complex protein RnfG [Reinekea marinisedimentorum]
MSVLTMDKETIAYQGGLLGVVAAAAAGILLLVSSLSSDAIALRTYEDKMAGLNQVLPPALYQNDLLATERSWEFDGQAFRVFVGLNAENLITGYAIQSTAQGYAGDINMLVGIDAEQNILAVRVLSHSETPGLGDKIERSKSTWVDAFESQSLSSLSQPQWAVKKDGGEFDQFTGATITPRAVVGQVHKTLQAMQQKLIPEISKEVSLYE